MAIFERQLKSQKDGTIIGYDRVLSVMWKIKQGTTGSFHLNNL